jgi:UDP-N-acetylmuramoyl-tripeptide--D-alanyl-D-alanine ligase
MLTLAHFLEALTQYEATGAEPAVTSVVMDSREAVPGCLFVAYAGEQVDGHDYVADAFARGAIAALVERPIPGGYATVDLRVGAGTRPASGRVQDPPLPVLPFTTSSAPTPVCLVVDNTITALQTSAKAWRARFPVQVIGVTGSVGKTSTKELTHAVLSSRYRTFKSAGNRNSVLGLPLTMFDLRPVHEYAVLEMGMYTTGEIARLCQLAQPKIGVVTLIGPVHLERAGSMDAIVAAKRELVEALPDNGMAVLNKDDERVMGMVPYTKAHIFTYGLDRRADLWADNIHSMGLDGIRFTLHFGREALSLQVPLLGRHSVHTALRAAAVGLITKLSWEEIAAGLRQTAAQLRLVTAPGPKNSIIIDDTYNASPESVLAALNLLSDLPGRRIAVLGDMLELGHMEEASHRLVGRRVADVADILVTVGRRGRWIGEEARAVGMPAGHVAMVEEASAAVPILEEVIRENDVILVKGSLGMSMDRIVVALGRYD